MNYTKGPWKFFNQTLKGTDITTVLPENDSQWGKGWDFKTIKIANENNEIIAEVMSYDLPMWERDFSQWEINARLIVAAPELLKALKNIIIESTYNDNGEPDTDGLIQSMASIKEWAESATRKVTNE